MTGGSCKGLARQHCFSAVRFGVVRFGGTGEGFLPLHGSLHTLKPCMALVLCQQHCTCSTASARDCLCVVCISCVADGVYRGVLLAACLVFTVPAQGVCPSYAWLDHGVIICSSAAALAAAGALCFPARKECISWLCFPLLCLLQPGLPPAMLRVLSRWCLFACYGAFCLFGACVS